MKCPITFPRAGARFVLALISFSWIAGIQIASAQSTALTYQGRLNDGGAPAILYSVQDVPLLKALGFYRVET